MAGFRSGYRTLVGTSALCALSLSAHALPQGGVVTGGSAVIASPSSSQLNVTQTSNRAVIDWQSFNVGVSERVSIAQPSTSSILLNRIHDAQPSQIFGQLSANGQVILTNPNGMVFGPSSHIDVGGLIATSSRIDSTAFLQQGQLTGTPGNPGASVINQGQISVKEGGLAALVSPGVQNSGVIVAKAGRVQLAAGDSIAYDLYGDGLLSVAASPTMAASYVGMDGQIQAQGGSVLLTAEQAVQLMSSAVSLDGLIEASGLVEDNGAVRLAGTVAMSAERVTLGSAARIQADGPQGGGTVHVGGGWQGAGELPWAKTVEVQQGARISANATDAGHGGEVVLWSKDATRFDGAIDARGGTRGGDGGRVETSSTGLLGITGAVNASSTHGLAGDWLLDPNNITIAAGAGADSNVTVGGGAYTGSNDGVTGSTVYAANLSATLNGGTNVIVQTNSAGSSIGRSGSPVITYTSGGTVSLTLKAHENIDLTNTTIQSTGAGALNTILWSDSDNTNSGYIQLTNSTITTNGGAVVLGGGLDDGGADDGIAGGIIGDGRPDNYAWGNGVVFRGVGMTGTTISSGNGGIRMIGHGGNGLIGGTGVWVGYGSSLQTQDGSIVLIGSSGTGSADYSRGIHVEGTTTPVHISGNGALTMTGYGMSSGLDSPAIRLQDSGNILVDGTGDITFNALGDDKELGTANNASLIGGPSYDGNIRLNADNFTMFDAFTWQTNGDIIVNSITAGRSIGLAGGGGLLSLDATELAMFDAGGLLIIGNATSGAVNINAWNLSGKTHDVEVHGSSIDFGGSLIWDGDNNFLYEAHAGSVLADQAMTKTDGGVSTVTLKARDNVTGSSTVNASAGHPLNLILWSDSNNDNNGYIRIANATVNTYGGDIIAAGGLDDGGLDDGIAGGTASDNRPDNFAWGNASVRTGATIHTSTVNTGTGGLRLSGHGDNAAASAGVTLESSSVTAGAVALNGVAGSSATANNYGVNFNLSSLTSVQDGIFINANGGSGLSNGNFGLIMTGSTLYSTGTGASASDVVIRAEGGDGGTHDLFGMYLAGTIQTVDGDIDIVANGGTGNSYSNLGLLLDGGRIESTGTTVSAGKITIIGNGGGTDCCATGIIANNGGLISSAYGAIHLTGNAAANNGYNMGIEINAARITSTGLDSSGVAAATITLRGNGGLGTWVENYGIRLLDGAEISSNDGDISLTGVAGNGINNSDIGIYLQNGSQILSHGTTSDAAAIMMTGTGGTGGSLNHGVHLKDAGTLVSSQIGDISITGTGVGGSGNNHGIYITDDADVTSTGSADVRLRGAPGVGGSAIATSNGAITIGGVSMTGDVTLEGNSFDLGSLSVQTRNTLTIKPVAAGTAINLGSGAVNSGLQLTDVELGYFTADTDGNGVGSLILGNSTGAVDVTGWNMSVLPYAINVQGTTVSVDNSASNYNITGTYSGTNGQLNAGTGVVNGTVRFSTLNIVGSSAQLLPGYIGAPGTATQNMANLITIGGLPGTGQPAYQFAGYNIGAAVSTPPAPPVVTPPLIVVPPVITPPNSLPPVVVLPEVIPPVAQPPLPPLQAVFIASVSRANNFATGTGIVDQPGIRYINSTGNDYMLIIDSKSYDAQAYSLSQDEKPAKLPLSAERLVHVNE